MGTYCNLYIGSTNLAWKDYIPEVVSLFFDVEDYCSTYDVENKFTEHKFITTCEKAVIRLEKFGISADTMRCLHFEYYAFNYKNYKESLHYFCSNVLYAQNERNTVRDVNRMADYFLHRYFKKLDKNEEFMKVLAYNKCHGNINDYEQRLQDEINSTSIQNTTNFDREAYERDCLRQFLQNDPYLYHLNEEFLDKNDGTIDLINLYDIGLKIFASNNDIQIEFEFTGLINTNKSLDEKAIARFLMALRSTLYRRNYISANIFNQILDSNMVNKSLTYHGQNAIVSAKEKGQFLENLVSSIFCNSKGFKVKQNVNHRGEEIDLLIINRVNDSFWNSLQSPLILAECKNQKKENRGKRN